MNINWKVRFSKQNMLFWLRFIGALLVPVLAYMGIRYEDLTTWGAVWDIAVRFFSNPFLVFLTVFNAINIVPDPTTKGISDSVDALQYEKPREDVKY